MQFKVTFLKKNLKHHDKVIAIYNKFVSLE